jgi:hypothetical protein
MNFIYSKNCQQIVYLLEKLTHETEFQKYGTSQYGIGNSDRGAADITHCIGGLSKSFSNIYFIAPARSTTQPIIYLFILLDASAAILLTMRRRFGIYLRQDQPNYKAYS